jgi:hypothetical protein
VWWLGESEIFARRLRWHRKRHPDETLAVLNNLDTYVRALNSGVQPAQIQASFVHREPKGVVAIDQSGAPRRLRETRLYIYACAREEVLYLITIGDKNSQQADLRDCGEFVDRLRTESSDG